jgi:hypothetical protein
MAAPGGAANLYFYKHEGRQYGPLDGTALWQMAADGKLLPTDLVQVQGEKGWVKADSFPWLLFPATTPRRKTMQERAEENKKAFQEKWEKLSLGGKIFVAVVGPTILLGLLALVVSAIYWIGKAVPKSDGEDSSSAATVMAEEFVKRQLKFPAEADFDWSHKTTRRTDGSWEVSGAGTGKNAFGVKIRFKYRSVVKHDGGDSWTNLGTEVWESSD